MTRPSILLGSLALVAATGVGYAALRVSADLRRVSRRLDALAREVTTMRGDLAAVAEDVGTLADDVDALANDLGCEEEPQEHVPLRGRRLPGPAASVAARRMRTLGSARAYERHTRVRAAAPWPRQALPRGERDEVALGHDPDQPPGLDHR